HHEIKTIELLKQGDVGKFVSRIRVAHQTDVRKVFAHALDDVQVPTRFDLDLDALVTGVYLFANLLQQDVGRVLNADGNSARDLTACAAKMFPQRHTGALRFEIPAGSLERGLRHAVTAHQVHQRER